MTPHPVRTTSRVVTLAAVATLLSVQACKQNDAANAAAAESKTAAMTVGPENIAVVKAEEIKSGPALSGSLSPETQATVRSEVSGAVLQTYVEAGSPVRQGQELARIDDSGIRDAYLSAKSAVTTADNTVQIAEREAGRAEALAKAGAIADRQRDQARNQLIGAQAQAADARARLANAQKQLEKTVIRAPFSGIVSARMINAGDFAAPGNPAYTIINPSTMRLEASVPAEALSAVRLGAPVEFTVNGYAARRFAGRISSINPVADPSVDERGVRPIVVRLKNGKVSQTEVALGIRDASTEMVEIKSGLTPGDTVLLGAARGISAGTMVKVSSPGDVKR